jgi:hypothetical protein
MSKSYFYHLLYCCSFLNPQCSCRHFVCQRLVIDIGRPIGALEEDSFGGAPDPLFQTKRWLR